MDPSLIVEDSCGRVWPLRPGCDNDPEASARIAKSIVVSLVGLVRHRGTYELACLLRLCAEASCDLAWRQHLRDISEIGDASEELGRAITLSLLRALATGGVTLARVASYPPAVSSLAVSSTASEANEPQGPWAGRRNGATKWNQ